MTNVQENKIKFIELLTKCNFDIQKLTEYLDMIDYYNKPFTAQYEGSYRGGLCEYTIKFAYELGKLCNAYYPGKYTSEDILKVALFKDMYKAVMYEEYQKNVKNNVTGEWETTTAWKTREGSERPTYGELGLSSYMLATKFITLTDEQAMAIIHAKATDYMVDFHEIAKSFPLLTLTKMADLAVHYLGENN